MHEAVDRGDGLLAEKGWGDLRKKVTTLRSPAWFSAATFLGLFLAVQLAPWPTETRAKISALMFLVPIGTAILSNFFTASSTRGKERRTWLLIAVGMSFFFAGMAYRAYHVFAFGDYPPPGSFEDYMFTIGFLMFIPVVLLMTEPFQVVGLRKLRNMIDFATMFMLMLALAYLFILAPLNALESDTSVMGRVALILYPVVSFAVVIYLLAFRRSRWHPHVLLILAALTVSAFGILGSTVGAVWGFYEAGEPYTGAVDSLWVITASLLALAGLTRLTEPQSVYREPTPELDLPHWPGIASLMIGILGLPALIYMATYASDPLTQTIVSFSAAAVAMLVVARSAVITLENRRLSEESYLDPLTGLFNYRYFRERLAREVKHALHDGDALSLCVIDIDDFEAFNLRYGYSAGDNRIRWLARMIKANVRDYDTVFRIGGDDIAVILPVTDAVQAYQDCLRVVRRAEGPNDGTDEPLHLSIGIASIPMHTSDINDLIRFAEGASYWAKVSGGNSIIIFDPQTVEALDSAEHRLKVEEISHTKLIESLAAAVDARDPYTESHSRNVSEHVEVFAKTVDYPEEKLPLLVAAGLLHDIGKIGVPDAILTKPTALEPDEFKRIMNHPALGVQILRASVRDEILPWVLAHHERWDGAGYPNGLRGEEIPYEARMLCICDAFDAMTSDRPYRKSCNDNEAAEEILQCAGTQFDPELARIFAGLIVEGRIRSKS